MFITLHTRDEAHSAADERTKHTFCHNVTCLYNLKVAFAAIACEILLVAIKDEA